MSKDISKNATVIICNQVRGDKRMILGILETLQELNLLSVFLRLILSMVCGGIIGIERGIRGRPAGFRTYMLVCLGAALVMMTNEFIVIKFNSSDPARLGAQVISGIGFLGAGTIIVTRHHQVKGLTTAAGLWASACMGLAIGIGFYEGALIGAILIFLIMTFMNSLDHRLIAGAKSMDIYVELNKDGTLSGLLSGAINAGIQISHIDIIQSNNSYSGIITAILTIQMPKRQQHYKIIDELYQLKEVSHLEEI